MFLQLLLLIFGVFAGSTAVIMIKASALHPVLLSSLRLLVATLALSPFFIRDYRAHSKEYTWSHLRGSLLPGILLALHFMTWITGARMTPAANASIIVNMVPLVMPFLLLALTGERVIGRECVGTVVAFSGILILAISDFDVSPQYFWGDVICFVSMVFFACYLALGRKNRHFPTVWLYLVPLYLIAGLICLIGAFFVATPFQAYPPREIALVLGLGIVPTVLGHSTLNYSMKHLRGQLVSIVNIAQFIFAGTMGYVFYNEVPGWTFLPTSLLFVVGAWLAITAQPGSEEA